MGIFVLMLFLLFNVGDYFPWCDFFFSQERGFMMKEEGKKHKIRSEIISMRWNLYVTQGQRLRKKWLKNGHSDLVL